METNKTDPSTESNSGDLHFVDAGSGSGLVVFNRFMAAATEAFVKQIESKILEHRRHAFDPDTGEYHQAEIVRLKEHPMLTAAYNQRQEALRQKYSEAVLFRWQ